MKINAYKIRCNLNKFSVSAALLNLLSSLATAFAGVIMLFLNECTLVAGIICFVTAVVLFASFIVGLTIRAHRKNCAFASAILSLISATALICCACVPGQLWFVILMTVICGVVNAASFLLFALCAAYIPKNPKASYKSYPPSKKKLKQIMLLPPCIMTAVVAAAIPAIIFGSYAYLYGVVENKMSNISVWDYMCGGVHSSFNVIWDIPDSYKDVAKIKSQYLRFKSLKSDMMDYGVSGEECRGAYIKLLQLEKEDSRWNFKNAMDFNHNAFLEGKWISDDLYMQFQIVKDIYGNRLIVDTNLPYDKPTFDVSEQESLRVLENMNSEFASIGYRFSDYSNYKICFDITEYNYSSQDGVFSIKVHCRSTDSFAVLTLVTSR